MATAPYPVPADGPVPPQPPLVQGLQRQIDAVRKLHECDLAAGAGSVWMPYALAEKYPEGSRSLPWQ